MTSNDGTNITAGAARFASQLGYADLPSEALHVGRRCMIDGIGQFIAGSTTGPVRLVRDDVLDQGGRPDALLPGTGGRRAPAALAARVLGTAGHALDWDDTQATRDSRHTYGLLTHPTVPPLAAALALSQGALGEVDGRRLMVAFQAGFEVECKIAEWMLPDAYRRGLHASAAEGTLGAAVTAARLMELDEHRMRHAIGIAASRSSAGIRANVGTMTKPLHFGAAAENGVTAALLAARGLEANPNALDGAYGFLTVFSGGIFEEKLREGFGRTFSIVEPGVAVKPYPSGILSHQAMDAMLGLVRENDLKPEDVATIRFHAGSNILKPLSYRFAEDHLQAKFCMPALLAMILLRRQAGQDEFTDEFVGSEPMRDMQSRIETVLDPEIERRGFDRIRSRIEVHTRDGRVLERWADERYRGSPEHPMSDAEMEEKFRVCTRGILSEGRLEELLQVIWTIDEDPSGDASRLAELMEYG